MPPGKREWVYGRNPVWELLRARRRRVYRLLIAQGVEPAEALAQAKGAKIPVQRVERQELDRIADHHQGVLAEVDPYPYSEVEAILTRAEERGEPPLILLLDMLQDPQNLATLLRTAEAVGVQGVVIPYRGGAGVSPAVVSASAGASEHLLVAKANLAQTIRVLKGEGVWVAGLENHPDAKLPEEMDLSGAMALVVGNEGEGMRRLVRESCDFLLRLPMRGRLESLNAAVAGSVALYHLWKVRGYRGQNPR